MLAKLVGFFKPPEYDTIEQTQKARFLHYALLVTTGGCILLAILNLPGHTGLSLYLFIVAGLNFLGIPANKLGLYTPVAIFVSALLLVLITYSLLVGVGLKDAGVAAYPIFILFTSYLFNKKAVFYTTLLSLGSITLVYFLGTSGRFTPTAPYSNQIQTEVLFVLFPATGFLLWVVVDNWEKTLKNLRETYDLTLFGWNQALEFRDHATEGHSQRVIGLTIALAEGLGVSRRQLDHIRRGALLHDIGKMGVPDAILLKESSLSEAEWVIVKMHPVYARQMLEGIPYLKAALTIPYSHHERWDGSGYPQGLVGEAIPLAARIFAVVDVWDALTSERPYRHAWSESQAQEYIAGQSGKQFDPRVVKKFMELVGNEKARADLAGVDYLTIE